MNSQSEDRLSDQRAAVLRYLQDHAGIDAAAVARARAVSARTGQAIEQVLNQLGSLSDADLASAYSTVLNCEIWDPDRAPIEIDLEALPISPDFLRRVRIGPIKEEHGVLTCIACDPLDEEALNGLVFATGRRLAVLAARPSDWARCFEIALGHPADADASPDERRLEHEVELVADASTAGAGARLVASVFEAAIASGASDIHFEPRRHDLRIRLRVDGRLVDLQNAPADLAAPAVSRVKVIANLDLGERRLPQDGRTTFVVGGRQIDVRVATSPTVFGEAAVLRILDRKSVPLDLDALSLSAPVVNVLHRAAKTPHGMFLITGPTGSGKTTTLYALLQTFAGSTKKVLTIEDPVEFHFDHVSQTQVAPQLGLTFAKALRSFLRQDPDVILVGEIRDPETAAVAVQAAMTGHLVLASVHANDALAVIPRLQDMGVEPYQLAAGFRGAAAQRLVRLLCPDCRSPRPPLDVERRFAAAFGVTAPAKVHEPKGCAACKQQGFKGRLLIAEAFLADDASLRAIADKAPLGDLPFFSDGSFKCMAVDGIEKAIAGLTTLEEVMAAIDG